jgi:3-hydroxy-9,10-secoandrosta-1,3,5(10)-triene-9,17-dione monooxygenase
MTYMPTHTLDRPTVAEDASERTAALVPALRARAQEIDAGRSLPADVVEELVASGLVRLANPERYGGAGDFDLPVEIAEQLARGSGSVSWCYSVWVQHNYMIAAWPEQAQDEYFADSLDVLCSSAVNPAGAKVERVDGGYELSGTWSFSSGCDHASWFMLAAGIGEPGIGYLLIPRADIRIEDTWFVSGLKGTGSKDVVVEHAFVPEHRVVAARDFSEGIQVYADRVSYRVPPWPLITLALARTVVGMAQGAVDVFEERLLEGASGIAGPRLLDVPAIQARLAEATVEVDVARLICHNDAALVFDRAERELGFTMEERVRFARNRAYAVRLAVQAANRLFDASGARGLYEHAEIQRFHRDVHAGSHQPVMAWDVYASQYGRIRLGLDVQTRMV